MSATGRRLRRISHEDLVEQSRSVLAQAGVGNHCRAIYLFKIGRELLVSEKPEFRQFHADVLRRNTSAWNRAFVIIFQYFVEHNLFVTNDIAALENHNSTPAHEGSSSTADEQLENLVDGAPPRRSVKQRLEAVRATSKGGERSRKSYPTGWQRRTPASRKDTKGVLLILSPAAPKKETYDSEGLSDFVIEEIRPRQSKKITEIFRD
jgi:hypothetical protein